MHRLPSFANQICPTCKIQLTGPPIRNIIAEKICDLGGIKKCKNNPCDYKATKVKLKDHESRCTYHHVQISHFGHYSDDHEEEILKVK
jgi:hypothetical protein